MNKLRLADQYALADSYLLAAGGNVMATTEKKCPPGYTYIPSQGNCQIIGKPKQAMNTKAISTLLRDNAENYYITVPTAEGGVIQVREDAFDYLDPMTWEAVMDILEPYNEQQVSGLFSKWRENRREKKEARNQRKIDKINARAAGRASVAAAGGGIGGALSKVAGAIFGGKNDSSDIQLPEDSRGVQFQVGNVPQRAWYTNPAILIPAGIGAAALIYFTTKKKKK